MASAVIGALRVMLSLDSAAFEEGMKNLRGTLATAGKSMQRVGRQMSTYVTAPIVAFGGLTLKAAGDFEKAMNQVAAVSGATGEQLSSLSDLAKELGATTQYTAAQAADAMGFLAMAGMEANDILAAMPDTLQLAAAAQLDMATSADIVTNILAGYNKDVSQLGQVTDVLVKAFTSANTDLNQLAQAMKYAGPVANAAGVQFEETAAALSLMGNAGIQAGMAGTSLRGAISRMVNPTKAMRDAMAEAGLAFEDSAGRLLPLADIIQQLEPHADNAGLFMELFGQRAGPAMAALVTQGSDAVRELTGELENSVGTAAEIAAVQMQGFNGAMRQLAAAFEALQLAIADSGLIEWATEFVQKLAAWVQEMSKTNPELLKWGTIVAGLAAVIGPVVLGLGLLATGMAAIGVPVAAVIAGLAALTAVVVAFWPEIVNLANTITTFLSGAWASFESAWDTTVAKVHAVKDAIVDLGRVGLAAMQAMVTGIIDWVGNKLSAAWDGVASKIDWISGKFYGLYDAVVGNSYIPDMVTEIGQWMGRLDGLMVQPVSEAVDAVDSTFSQVGQTIAQSIGSAFQGLIDGSKKVKDVLRDLLVQLGQMLVNRAFQALFSGGGSILGSLFGGFGGFFANGGTLGAGKWGIAGEYGPEIIKGPAQVIPNHALGDRGGGVTVDATATIDARGADPSAIARLEMALRKRDAELPGRIIEGVRKAQKSNVKLG